MLRFLTSALVATSLLLGLASATQAAAGDLDPSFGTGGLVTTDFDSRGDFGLAGAIQPDGKIVVAGNSSAVGVFSVDFALARYNVDGSLDTSFGSGGTVRTDLGAQLDAAFDTVLQPDGKIIAVGISAGDFAIVRYTADGSLDETFGSGGWVTTDFSGSSDQASGVALQADGRIVVVGHSSDVATFATEFAVARYSTDGSLDPTFGSGGKVLTDFGPFDAAFDVVLTSGEKILAAGRNGSDFALAQYEPTGALDEAFGSGGKVTTDFGGSDQAFALALDSAGRATVVGAASGDFGLARYNADGSLDGSFGSGGTVTTDFSSGSPDTAFGLVIRLDGSITVAGGTSGAPGSSSFAVARYTSTGALDEGFGSGGTVATSFGDGFANANDVLTQADGKIVAVGGRFDPAVGAGDFALARYLGAPSAITVIVDVKPGSEDNVVPLQSNGVVPVAILTTDSFDATSVDPASVCFGDAEDASGRDCTTKHGHFQFVDVNGDARPDLLLHYEVEQTGIDPGDTDACLTGTTHAGAAIEGCDQIVTR